MTTREEFEASKRRLEELSEKHRQAVAKVGELKIQLDDAGTEAMKVLDQLSRENERYMALEKKLAEPAE
jgi:hypothetical protein